MGLVSAYELLKAGFQVEVFESETVGNHLGGSGGNGRIFRLTYEEPEVVEALVRTREAWLELEGELGQPLLREVGSVDYGNRDRIGAMAAALKACGVDCELLNPEESLKRMPALGIDDEVLVQSSGAVVESEAFLFGMLAAVRSLGGEVNEGCKVDQVLERSGKPALLLNGEEVFFDSIVITAGAGTHLLCRDLLDLPEVRITQEFTLECDLDVDLPVGSDYGPMPISGDGYYWLNSEPGRLKLGAFASGPELLPGAERASAPPRELAGVLTKYVSQTFLGGNKPSNVQMSAGIFDSTDDGWFFFRDTYDARIVAVGGFSGHGFKFAPLVGRAVARAIESYGEERPSGLPWSPAASIAV